MASYVNSKHRMARKRQITMTRSIKIKTSRLHRVWTQHSEDPDRRMTAGSRQAWATQ